MSLPGAVALDAAELRSSFVPTRRFAHVSFDSYQPDPRYRSQAQALTRLQSFAVTLNKKPGPLNFFSRQIEPRGIYLDGGYGVGKTHLLAAAYRAVHGQNVYLSFAELAYTISRLGLQPALDVFKDARMIAIDEFELDDVAQTRMASMFLRQLLARASVHVVTTSNTLPSDLGQGRFAADAFQREIGEIAGAFEVVSIDGEDYRHRRWDELAPPRVLDPAELEARFAAQASSAVKLAWPDLARQLESVHPVHYARMAGLLQALYIADLNTISDQAVALRLVHFVDKLYDQEVRLSVSSAVPLTEVFAPAYRHGGYEKKYRRCLSRLHELLSEN